MTHLIGDVERFAKMAKVAVSSVDSTGAIFYSIDGKHYKVYRDAAGNVIVILVRARLSVAGY